MTDETMLDRGTLVVAWMGPSLPLEVVSREAPEADQSPIFMDGTTGQQLILPPGNYLVKATLPAWTGLNHASVTVPVRIDAGKHVQEDLGDEISARLARLDLKAAVPFSDATVFVRPVTGEASSGGVLEFGVKHSSNLQVTATVDAEAVSHFVTATGSLISKAASYLLPYLARSPSSGTESESSAAEVPGGPDAVPRAAPASFSGLQRYEKAHGLIAGQLEGRSTLAVVPVDRTGGTAAALRPPPPDAKRPLPPRLDLIFDDPQLNTLWLFMREGAVGESRRLAENVPSEAKWLDGEMKVLERSPLSATLDAYVLLRANWRDDLRAFTEQALASDPHLADIRVIHAELLGRTGEHAAAADTLAGLGRGAHPWPLFRPGMTYALARARLYAEADNDGEQLALDIAVQKNLSRMATSLSAVCAALDPNQIPVVLTGSCSSETLRTLLSGLES